MSDINLVKANQEWVDQELVDFFLLTFVRMFRIHMMQVRNGPDTYVVCEPTVVSIKC